MFPDPATAAAPQGVGRLGSISAYVAAVAITVFAVVSQYFVPQLLPVVDPIYRSFWGGLFVVYGIPILAFAVLVGARPLDRFAHRTGSAALPALGWYGALALLSLAVTFALIIVYLALDPSALDLLDRPNPVVQEAQSNPWFWVGFSFAIGAIEETIFRGWVFGYWLARGTSIGWVHAVWTSALFAGVHLYYATTYGLAAPLVYPTLFFLGLAFALAVQASGGNLVWVALLHGANDATAFLTIVSPLVANSVHFGVILIGAAIALILYLRRPKPVPVPPPPFTPTFGGTWETGLPYGTPYLPPTAVSVVPPPLPPPPDPPPPRPP
jgi:hypothetical protein